jgi:hypothetical protein
LIGRPIAKHNTIQNSKQCIFIFFIFFRCAQWMEQPKAARTDVEAAAVAHKEELSTLSTRQLLEELRLALPLHYRTEGTPPPKPQTDFMPREFVHPPLPQSTSGGLTIEAYKAKVLGVLLTRDIAAFTTEELSLFLRVCPKKANNSKPVEHAER